MTCLRKKFFRNKKALSPVISGIILIAVTVAVAVAATTWLGSMTFSFMGIEELRITECQWAQDASYVDLTVINFGTKSATLNKVELNGVLANNVSIISGSSALDAGEPAVLRITQSFSSSAKYRFTLFTATGTVVECVARTDSTSVVQQIASLHYVNSTSNVDSSSDKGTHSNFANQQAGPDSVFDTLTEGGYGGGSTSIIQYANSSGSNVDGSADVGTETNFVNAQNYSPDSVYMTLQEENLGGSGGYPSIRSKTFSVESSNTISHDVSLPATIEAGDTLLVVFVCDDNEAVTWENEGVDWNVIYEEDGGNSGPTMSIAWKKAVGNEDGTTITVSTGTIEQSAHMSYAIQDADDPNINPPEASSEASNSNSNPNPASLSPSGGSNPYLWFAFQGNDDDDATTGYPASYPDNQESHYGGSSCNIGGATRTYTGSSDDPGTFTIAASEQWEAATVAVYPKASADDYELDFEYQWTSADYDETTEQVCIYVQTASQGGENLVAYEWNGAAWQSLGTLSSDGWNNFTASYLTGATYTINIRDGNKSNEGIPSTWLIDCILTNCSSTTATNYELDLEIQFTDINISKNYEEISIFVGSATGEALDVYIWNGGSWDSLATGLTPNQWNNVTRTITEDTVTLRFLLGGSETSDSVQDS